MQNLDLVEMKTDYSAHFMSHSMGKYVRILEYLILNAKFIPCRDENGLQCKIKTDYSARFMSHSFGKSVKSLEYLILSLRHFIFTQLST